MMIKISQTKYLLIGFLPILTVGVFFIVNWNFGDNVKNIADISNDSLEEKFTMLSNANTNYCAPANVLNSKADGERMQGSCCSKMDFHRYEEQIEGLKQYSSIDVIPSDPYDIEISLAKRLISYDKEITLTVQQQEVYEKAVGMSKEGGPCCCKCWRWTAFEGQAKYLITEYNFDEKQVAHVWELEDGCGGTGHVGHSKAEKI